MLQLCQTTSTGWTERVLLRMLLQLCHVFPFFVVCWVLMFYCLLILIDNWHTFDVILQVRVAGEVACLQHVCSAGSF